jgi:hypothetical protein
MPARFKPLLAATALVVALAAASPAAGQQAPTLGAPETTPSTAAAPADTSESGNGGGLKTWQEVLIFCAGLVLLAGIGFAIVGDARERAGRLTRRGREPEAAGVPHKHRQQAKQRARARSRAAKAQRRKNR